MLFFLYFAPSLSFPPASISLTVHSASHRTPQHIFGLFSGQFSPTLLILHPPSMPRPYLSLSLFTPPVSSFVHSPLRHIYVHISFWLSLLIVWPRFLIRYDGKSIPRPSLGPPLSSDPDSHRPIVSTTCEHLRPATPPDLVAAATLVAFESGDRFLARRASSGDDRRCGRPILAAGPSLVPMMVPQVHKPIFRPTDDQRRMRKCRSDEIPRRVGQVGEPLQRLDHPEVEKCVRVVLG